MSLAVLEKAIESFDKDPEKHIEKYRIVAKPEWQKILEKIRNSLKHGGKVVLNLLEDDRLIYRHVLTDKNVRIYDIKENKLEETLDWRNYLNYTPFPHEAKVAVKELRELEHSNQQLYKLIQ